MKDILAEHEVHDIVAVKHKQEIS